jgi:hypothetical protein
MKTVKVQAGQTLIDIAIQELGDGSRVAEIAVLNDLNITEDLLGGTILKMPDADISKRSLVNLFRDKSNAPASWITADEEVRLEGIGYWYIDNDFVVK